MSKNKKTALLLFYNEKNRACKILKKNIISKDKISLLSSKVIDFYKIKSQLPNQKMMVKLCFNLQKIIQNLRNKIFQVKVQIINLLLMKVRNKFLKNKIIKIKLYLKFKNFKV